MNAAPQKAPDALGERLAQLRARRRDPGWAELLLALGRDLTVAEAGAVLAREVDGWATLTPDTTEAPPAAWTVLADMALQSGLAAAPTGREGRWLFAVSVGPADPPGAAPRRGALVLEVGSALPMDLVLTRERMVFLAALADAGATEAGMQAQAPRALAASTAEALLTAPNIDDGLHAAAAAIAAALPGVERVALVHGRRIGLSDQRRVELRAELPRRLLALGGEALDRGAPRRAMPGEAMSPAERAHAEAFGARPLLTVPAHNGAAALVVSFAPGQAVPEELGARLLPVASLLGALPAASRRAGMRVRHRWLAGGAAALAVIGLLAVLPCAAVVGAPVVLQPERAQVVTAPFDGLLDASTSQPGDQVTAGVTQLARLATRELELELSAARARAANDRREAAVARAAGQPAQDQIALLSARRAEAQVALLEYRLRLSDIRAPSDGVIIAGDLRRSLGQPLTRGQVLFEIALPGPLRAEILVLDEHAPAVRQGQIVRFSTAAEPGRVREAMVERIRPMAEPLQGRNIFRVIARLEPGEAADLRPGMEGWALIETGETTWLGWLLHDPVRWVRRQFWI